MGNSFNRLFKRPDGPELRILILGLDKSGKTTALYRLKGDRDSVPEPTVGYNLGAIVFNGLHLSLWDVGGDEKIRDLWKHYYAHTAGLIFMVDVACPERITEARTELHRTVMDAQLMDVPVLIFANKSDLESLNKDQLREKLELDSLKCKTWTVIESCASKGIGLDIGLSWLVGVLKKDKASTNSMVDSTEAFKSVE